MIDLRSDTVTKPTETMRKAMFSADLGDDVFGEDPTVNMLQEKVAEMFGFEAALFCASGTMGNQLAIKTHCRSGDELICSSLAHIYLYEGGGTASNSGVQVKMTEGDRGRLRSDEIEKMISEDDAHFPKTRLVCLEDSMNKGGGAVYEFKEIQKIRSLCIKKGLKLHLDGARVFNALVENKIEYHIYGSQFDSISICLSKGLGCPVGSVLLGSKKFIHQAHRYRKTFGGGMRQAGFLAAAGIFALDNHIERLLNDHEKAKKISDKLRMLPFVDDILPVETNIVVFKLKTGISSESVVEEFREKGVLIVPFGPNKARIVTHLDFTEAHLKELLEIFNKW